MKITITFLFPIFLLIGNVKSSTKVNDDFRIVVFDFKVVGKDLSEEDGSFAAATIRSYLNQYNTSSSFRILERDQMNILFEDKGLANELNQVFDLSTAAKFGKVVGAKYAVIGEVSMSNLSNKIKLSARIVEIETAAIIGESQSFYDNLKEFECKTLQISCDLLKKLPSPASKSACENDLAKCLEAQRPAIIEGPIIEETPKEMPSPKTNILKIDNCLSNYTVEYISSIGSASSQSVDVKVRFKHKLPNQKLTILKTTSKAYDISGNTLEIYKACLGTICSFSPDEIIPTDVSLNGTIKIRNVLENTKLISKLLISVVTKNAEGGKDKQSCIIEVTNVPIIWGK